MEGSYFEHLCNSVSDADAERDSPDINVYIVIDLNEDVIQEIEQVITDSNAKRLSAKGEGHLMKMFLKNRDVFLKLVNETTEKVHPMKIKIEKNARLVNFKYHLYAPWKISFRESYTDQLV